MDNTLPVVVQALRDGVTLEWLDATYGITSRSHKQFPNLINLKYDQIRSDKYKSDLIVKQCRGIVLDKNRNWEVVARPLNRFFNEGESCADEMEWSTTIIMEKLDGSLIIAYPYNSSWQIATSGTPDASGEVQAENVTNTWEITPGVMAPFPTSFEDYFRQVARLTSDVFDQPTEQDDWSYFFELMGPLNRVVVEYPYAKIALLGARHIDGTELTAEQAAEKLGQPFQIVRTFNIHNLHDLITTFAEMNPFEQEGYVGCDANFNRRKFKDPKYVSWHHARGSLTPRSLLGVVRRGEADEFCASFRSFTEVVKRVREIQNRYDKLIVDTDQLFNQYMNQPSRKDFAMQVKHMPVSGALFYLWQHRTSSEGFYREQMIDSLMNLLVLRTNK